MSATQRVAVHAEVAAALRSGTPVVGLESAVLAQAASQQDRLDALLGVEQAVREAGAVPATTGCVDGRLLVGLDPNVLERLVDEGTPRLSTRHLGAATVRREHGTTTTAAAMFLCRRAGIELLAAGAIGGLDWGPERDESADLLELSRTPVTVVCVGPKPFVDLRGTRERLESLSVPVGGYAQDDFVPIFRAPSGLLTDFVVADPEAAAAVIRAQRGLGLSGILMVAAPRSELRFDRGALERRIARARERVASSGAHGHEITPRLLSELAADDVQGATRINMSLLEDMASCAGRIAVALAR